jgi:hypothetical protein
MWLTPFTCYCASSRRMGGGPRGVEAITLRVLTSVFRGERDILEHDFGGQPFVTARPALSSYNAEPTGMP